MSLWGNKLESVDVVVNAVAGLPSLRHTFTLPHRVHHELTEHERCCMQNNQLPTKGHVELEDDSVVVLPRYMICWVKVFLK